MKSDAPLHASPAGRENPASLPPLPAGEAWPAGMIDALPGMAYLGRADRARTLDLVSAGCETLLGLKPGHKPFQLLPLIHPDNRDEVLEVVKTAVAQNHPFAMEYRARHANGDWRTVWEQGRPSHRGHRAGIQGQLVDVTHRLQCEHARLRAELRLLQDQKFQALNQLAGGVAHEFNNLIAGILGSAELLAMDLPEAHPGHDSLKHVFEASNLARDFVHKLRLLGQRLPPDFKPVRLQPVIEESLQILRNIIPARVELQAHISPDCPKVNADPAQIHQAILDLCLHAWHGLADRRGLIKISLANCPAVRPPGGAPSILQPGPHVCLTVEDDSLGLETGARDHIFHPFRSRRSGAKKVGLELFLVREIIQAHLGEISLETEPGSGLVFRVYLPVAGEK